MFPSSSSSSISFLQPSFLPNNLKASKVRNAYSSRRIVAASATTKNRASCSSSATKMASPASFYEVLGISMSASCHEIKAAYRKLARTCHPDVVSFNQKETSANEFMKIHSAYSTLSDPNKRAQYDTEIYRDNRRRLEYSSLTSENIASMSGYRSYAPSGRKWETDQCW